MDNWDIICPFCLSNKGSIALTKNLETFRFYCKPCKTMISFNKNFKESFCGNLILAYNERQKIDLPEIEISIKQPIIGKYLCIVCNSKYTRVVECKKRTEFLYCLCINCMSKMFIKKEYFPVIQMMSDMLLSVFKINI